MRSIVFGFLAFAIVFSAAPSRAGDDNKPDPGFTLIFNGKDLTGWKTKKGGEPLDGKTEAYKGRFKVKDGVLVLDPSVKGDLHIHTAKEYAKDVHFKFQFKPGDACNNDIFFRGKKFDILLKLKGVKPGEWNDFDLIAAGDKVTFKINGQDAKPTDNKGANNTLNIRAEFGNIEIRRIQVKE